MCHRPDFFGAVSFARSLQRGMRQGAADDFAKQKCTLGSRWPAINTRHTQSSLHGEVAYESS